MEHLKADEILERYRKGTASVAEEELVVAWLTQNRAEELSTLSEEVIRESRERMWANIAAAQKPLNRIKLWPRIAGVAAAVAAIVLCTWLYYSANTPRHPEFISGSPLANDIAPGKNTATLTLANGQTINLSDAKTGVVIDAGSLKYNDGTDVASSLRGGTTRQPHTSDEIAASRNAPRNDDMMLTAATPRGGQYQITLPDGTRVWLNADSKISFPAQFIGKERKVLLLNGEAYFEVAKLTRPSLRGGTHETSSGQAVRIPFIVESKGQQVEVLGTHFNISAYNDEEATKTTLLEGSVRVSSLRGGTHETSSGQAVRQSHDEIATSRRAPRNDVILKPNQQAVLTANKLDVITANIEQILAWKNGQFAFQKQSLQEIMWGISRWYDVEVVFEPGFESIPFTGSVSRFKNISSVLHILELTGKVHFKIEGRRVTVMK
jgi:transmembrane sensor